jgi:hypothetical protein
MYLTDDPIQKLEDDELGRTAFVEELAQSLLSRDITESLVISLDGPWGSGKSSVLNLLESRIKSNNLSNTVILRFDPWYFNSTEKLLQSFFDEINRVVEIKIPGNEIAKKIKKYKKVLTSVQFAPKASLFGMIELSLGSFDVDLENPEKIRTEIKDLISKANTRAIILVDNLDRLDITELLLIFKLVRLCSDFPGFTFVLALDKQQILKLLERSNLSFEFIDKIIQVDIKLPTIEQFRIDNFLSKGLEFIANTKKIKFDDFFWTRFSQVYQSTIAPKLMTTLRDAKRFLNTADFSLPIVKGEVDYADFLILQILRVFFPDVYEFIPLFKSELTKLDVLGYGYDDWRKKEKIAVFKELSEKVQAVAKENSKVANDLLVFLFPNYRTYLQNPQNPSIQAYTNEFEKYQFIASKSHFDRYFTMRVAGDDIPTSTILEFVDRLNTEGFNLNVQEQFVTKYLTTNNLVLALKKLDLYVGKLNEDARLHLIRSLSLASSAFDSKRTSYWESEISSVKKLVTSCILAFAENLQIELINETISSSSSLLYSVLIAQDSVLGGWYPFTDEIRKTFLEVIRARIHKDLIDEKINVFNVYPTGFSTILGSWGNKDFLNEEELAKQYTKELLDKKPEYAIKILSMYVWVIAGTEKPSEFGFGDFSSRQDPKEIKSFIEKLDLTKLSLSERERFAVKEFNRLFDLKFNDKTNE